MGSETGREASGGDVNVLQRRLAAENARAPARAPVLLGGPSVISIVGKSCGSTAVVMEKVPLPLPGTWNVPAAATCWRFRLTYQH